MFQAVPVENVGHHLLVVIFVMIAAPLFWMTVEAFRKGKQQ